jgi:hypothetical protein
LAQFDCDEHQDALDKNRLTGDPDMPDGLVGIAPTSQIIGLPGAARLDSPEIDPGDNGWIVFLTGEGTKGRKIVKAIDDERVSGFSGRSHG